MGDPVAGSMRILVVKARVIPYCAAVSTLHSGSASARECDDACVSTSTQPTTHRGTWEGLGPLVVGALVPLLSCQQPSLPLWTRMYMSREHRLACCQSSGSSEGCINAPIPIMMHRPSHGGRVLR